MSNGTVLFVVEKGIEASVCFFIRNDLVGDLDAIPLQSHIALARGLQLCLAIDGNGNGGAALVANQIVDDLVRNDETQNVVFHSIRARISARRSKCARSSITSVHSGTPSPCICGSAPACNNLTRARS